uniref:Uncharacterized protein n=1 Tax=Acrobeloides nanus TaxID=290746 RepID=A0A914CN98_9BILA
MLPLVYIVTTMFLGISDIRFSMVLNLGFSWIPFVNGCTTIYFVRPYKDGAKRLLCGKCSRIAHQWHESNSNSINIRTIGVLRPFIDQVSINQHSRFLG